MHKLGLQNKEQETSKGAKLKKMPIFLVELLKTVVGLDSVTYPRKI